VFKDFGYIQAAEDAGISPEDLAALRTRIESQYPSQTLREIHLYMLCKEIGAGRLTVAEALKPPTGELPPISEIRMGG